MSTSVDAKLSSKHAELSIIISSASFDSLDINKIRDLFQNGKKSIPRFGRIRSFQSYDHWSLKNVKMHLIRF